MEMMPMEAYGLKGVRMTSNGRRHYDPAGKARLVEACLESGVSVARLALEHGVNANQLRRWVMKRGQRSAGRLPDPSAFVRVETSSVGAARQAGEVAGDAAGLMSSARLQTSMPNGVSLTLERCDVQLPAVMIDAPGRV